MDQLPNFGVAINEVLVPTFNAYEELLRARETDIRAARRETHKYGPNPRHLLDIYIPDNGQQQQQQQQTKNKRRQTVLVFLHGGGFYEGSRANETYGGGDGLIFGNIGRFFTARFGVAVVVPDYRLLAHGARYPSGGEDLALVMDWIGTRYADAGADVVVLGNSAGGVHTATFLLDQAFEGAREKFVTQRRGGGEEGVGVRLRGVVFLGTPFHWGDAPNEPARTYHGADTVFENAPVGRLRAAAATTMSRLRGNVKILILLSEMDPKFLFDTADEFKREWLATAEGGDDDIEMRVIEGHNHISPPLGLGTGIEREEAWGVQVAEFLRACAPEP